MFEIAAGHRAIRSISAASAVISRAAVALRGTSETSRPNAGIREDDTLADPGGESRRLMVGQRFGDLGRNERARTAPVQDEPRKKPRTERARLLKQPQHLGRRPPVER